MREHDPFLQRHILGRLHHRDVQRLRRVLRINDRSKRLPIKPSDHLVRNRLVHFPHRPNHPEPIEPRKLRPGRDGAPRLAWTLPGRTTYPVMKGQVIVQNGVALVGNLSYPRCGMASPYQSWKP